MDDWALEGYGLSQPNFPCPVEICDFCNPVAVKLIPSSGTVLVCDDAFNDEVFLERVVPQLRALLDKGGTAVVLAYHGVFHVPERLGEIFGCNWKFKGTIKHEFVATHHLQNHFSPGQCQRPNFHSPNLLAVPEGEAMRLDVRSKTWFYLHLQDVQGTMSTNMP